jgi:hypothetical protein
MAEHVGVDKAVNITLELRVEGDELVGSARNGTGEDREFLGWLGLLCAIDALLEDPPAPHAPRPAPAEAETR